MLVYLAWVRIRKKKDKWKISEDKLKSRVDKEKSFEMIKPNLDG